MSGQSQQNWISSLEGPRECNRNDTQETLSPAGHGWIIPLISSISSRTSVQSAVSLVTHDKLGERSGRNENDKPDSAWHEICAGANPSARRGCFSLTKLHENSEEDAGRKIILHHGHSPRQTLAASGLPGSQPPTGKAFGKTFEGA